jgi:Fusaric acid resistance protein-like
MAAFREVLRRRVDVLVAFDPGLNQLLMAVSVVVLVASSLGVTYLLMQATHILWIEPPHGAILAPAQAAQLAAQHHGETLLAMVLAGIVGMLTAFAVADTKLLELVKTMAPMPVPMLATMALAVQFLNDRAVGILGMAVVMAVAVYMPKFGPRIGPRAFLFGILMFIGYLFGFLSRGAIVTSDLGWIAVILYVAVAVNFGLRLCIFIPLARGTLRRTIRAFFARSRGVIVCSAQLFIAEGDRERRRVRRRLHRRLARLNEAALIADALLATHPETAQHTHEQLFQTELGVQNIGRLADSLCDVDLPGGMRRTIREMLLEARHTHKAMKLSDLSVLTESGSDPDLVKTRPLVAGRVMRLADALLGWKLATDRWRDSDLERVSDPVPFQTAVTLAFGNLPGSALVTRAAAAPPGSLRARFGLDFPAQTAIRIGIAVVIAASIGSVLSERRFYWAVIAVFVSFMGTNTTDEQILKATQRVAGTVIGILIGSVLANAIGHSTWSVVVVLGALFFGIYFTRASYMLMVLGVTIMVSQLYVQLGEYSNHLLVLRLEETAIGAAVAALAALLIFPIHARHAVRVAAGDYYARLGDLLDGLMARLCGEPAALTAASRGVDSASHALRSAALPLSRSPFRSDDVQHNLMLFAQAAHHSRNITAGIDRQVDLDGHVQEAAVATLRTQRHVVRSLEDQARRLTPTKGHLTDHQPTATDTFNPRTLTQELRDETDLLALSLHARGSWDERQLLRHITRLDETLAELGENLIPSKTNPARLR